MTRDTASGSVAPNSEPQVSMPVPATDGEKLLAPLVAGLAERGYGVVEGAIAPELVDRLIFDCRARETAGVMADAGIGRHQDHAVESGVRRVRASWLNGGGRGEEELLALTERLRLAINRQLFLGLFEFEAQFLTYPPGGFYARHLDSLAGARNRVVSLVLYLNPGWTTAHGGELEIWSARDADGPPTVTVAPRAGTLVAMLSEEIPHAVRPSSAVRRVIAGWFRVNASSDARIDPAR